MDVDSMMLILFTIVAIIAAADSSRFAVAFSPLRHAARRQIRFQSACKSPMQMQPIEELADDDLVALPFDGYLTTTTTTSTSDDDEAKLQLRLCVIRNQQYIYPLIRHEDDVETDLFLDPRFIEKQISLQDILQWWNANNSNNEVKNELQYYGVGWYGQRPVPSLGGGPGYGAEVDEVWSIDEDLLEQLLSEDGVDLPVIDVGMAHGEKARGGALF
mmetsp:Transcript_17801/g.26819  ORF Transcript_17801/g.26819 Transcript_17801/m.26819 type:complete len:216 (+) Transcript_17801:74-721(+)